MLRTSWRRRAASIRSQTVSLTVISSGLRSAGGSSISGASGSVCHPRGVLPGRDDIALPPVPPGLTWIGGTEPVTERITARGPLLVHFFEVGELSGVRTLPFVAELHRALRRGRADRARRPFAALGSGAPRIAPWRRRSPASTFPSPSPTTASTGSGTPTAARAGPPRSSGAAAASCAGSTSARAPTTRPRPRCGPSCAAPTAPSRRASSTRPRTGRRPEPGEAERRGVPRRRPRPAAGTRRAGRAARGRVRGAAAPGRRSTARGRRGRGRRRGRRDASSSTAPASTSSPATTSTACTRCGRPRRRDQGLVGVVRAGGVRMRSRLRTSACRCYVERDRSAPT